MPTVQSRPRDAALDAAAADGRALRAALGETASWRAPAEALARTLVEATLDSRGTLFEVQRAFAIFPPGSPAGDSLFRLPEALPRIPDRPSRIAMLADRVPAPGRRGGYRTRGRRRVRGRFSSWPGSVRGAGWEPGPAPWGRAGPWGKGESPGGAAGGGAIVGARGGPPQTRRHADRGAPGEG